MAMLGIRIQNTAGCDIAIWVVGGISRRVRINPGSKLVFVDWVDQVRIGQVIPVVGYPISCGRLVVVVAGPGMTGAGRFEFVGQPGFERTAQLGTVCCRLALGIGPVESTQVAAVVARGKEHLARNSRKHATFIDTITIGIFLDA